MNTDERIKQLESQIQELLAWRDARERQQLAYPLDDPSRNIIGGLDDDGAGATTTTQSIGLSGSPETIQVPAAYVGTRLILIDGVRYEIPYIATS